ADAALRPELILRPNTSLYRAAGRLRYAEARLDGKLRSYHLVAVEPTDYLEATLARARDGVTAAALAAPLVDEEAGIAPEDAARGLAGLPAEAELPRLFQVDLTKPPLGTRLGPEVVAEALRAVELLHRLGAPAGQDALARFREAFARRYEDREVPLAEALDE